MLCFGTALSWLLSECTETRLCHGYSETHRSMLGCCAVLVLRRTLAAKMSHWGSCHGRPGWHRAILVSGEISFQRCPCCLLTCPVCLCRACKLAVVFLLQELGTCLLHAYFLVGQPRSGLDSSKVSGGGDSETSQEISSGTSRGQLLDLVEDCVWTCDA